VGELSSNIEDVRGVASAAGDRRVGLERRSCGREDEGRQEDGGHTRGARKKNEEPTTRLV
jgi:hypothetical protein